MKIKTETSIERKYELIQKTCLSNSELMELASCGYKTAVQIRNEISESIKPKILPSKIPTSLVISHLSIDIDLIIRIMNFAKNGVTECLDI